MQMLRAYAALLFEQHRDRVAALFALMLLGALTEGIGMMLLVPLIDLLSGAPSAQGLGQLLWNALSLLHIPHSIGGVLIAFVVLVALRSAIQYWRDRLSSSLQHTVVDNLRMKCFTAVMQVEWRWLVNGRKSDQANLLLTDVSRIGIGLNFALSLQVTLITLAIYLLAAIALSWQMTLAAFASGILVLGLLSGQRRAALHLGRSMGQANRALQANVQEALGGIKLAKILGNECAHLSYFEKTVAVVRQQQLTFTASTSLSRSLLQFGGATLLAVYLYLGLSYSLTPVPQLLTLVLIFSRMLPAFSSLQQQYHHCLHTLPALMETRQLMAECQAATEPIAETTAAWPIREQISLKDLTIRYAGRDAPALNKVSLTFPARTTTAIMGPSGAGKSTLADVLMGLLAPDNGELRIDGALISGANRMRWRHSVAYVPQDVFLFHDTIRSNLLWGKAEATNSELSQALHLAAADFVTQLPQGINTVVGDGGVRLSGGERQRIALARALLCKPGLLILDEATSALDVENEARIRDAIVNLHGDLTVVIIGHRLMTLEHADQVVVLEAGRIVRQGMWQEING